MGYFMKKIAAVVIFAISLAGSAFAEDVSIKGLNFSVPLCRKTGDTDSTHKLDFSSLGFGVNFNKMSVTGGEDWGYSSVFGAGIGYADSTMKNRYNDASCDFSGIDLNVKWGWGIAPLCREKIILAVHVFAGLDLCYLEAEESTYKYATYDFDVLLGGDIFCAVRIVKNLSLTAGIDIASNLAGFGTVSAEFDDHGGVTASYKYVGSGFYAAPRVGISWIM